MASLLSAFHRKDTHHVAILNAEETGKCSLWLGSYALLLWNGQQTVALSGPPFLQFRSLSLSTGLQLQLYICTWVLSVPNYLLTLQVTGRISLSQGSHAPPADQVRFPHSNLADF